MTEEAMTENVSPSGARVVAKIALNPDELVYMTSSVKGFRTSARVIYCQPLSNGQFAIGLKVQGPHVDWGSIC